MTRTAVVFGAGNVGRGFLGQLFSESGYEVVFVDIDQRLIEALRSERAYTLRLVDNDHTEEVRVAPVTGLLATDADAVAEAVASAALCATAVGARALPDIAPLLAAGLARRAAHENARPLNIIVCENLVAAPAILRDLVARHLPDEHRAYLDEQVGMVETVIGRMVPEPPPDLRERGPLLIVAEPHKELPVDRVGFVGAPPDIVGMQPVAKFEVYAARKLYLHNAGHAVLGYLGYQRGLTYGYEALEDPDIRPILEGAWDEAVRGIASRYEISEGWLREHTRDLARRFANRALADPIVRLARDPLRKLAPQDRLVGAARVAEYGALVPVNLSWGIAAALAYDELSDPTAGELQRRIEDEGVEAVLEGVCGIRRDEALGVAVLTRYRILTSGEPWP